MFFRDLTKKFGGYVGTIILGNEVLKIETVEMAAHIVQIKKS